MKKLSKKNIVSKIGILGGTFDPPHKGHLYISKIALQKLRLNKLILAITKKNPLKKDPFLKIKIRITLSKKKTKSKFEVISTFKEKNIKDLKKTLVQYAR